MRTAPPTKPKRVPWTLNTADGFALISTQNCGHDVVIFPTTGHYQMDVLGCSRHDIGTQHNPKNLSIPLASNSKTVGVTSGAHVVPGV